MSESTTYGTCLFCGNDLLHGDWVVKADEIRKMVADPANVPDGMAHKDCIIHSI
jgi:hypothetical protein